MNRVLALTLLSRKLFSLKQPFYKKSSFSFMCSTLLHYNVKSIGLHCIQTKYILQKTVIPRKAPLSPFHTSARSQINPLLWMLIKPAGKALSIISGRSLRRWWQALPPKEKYRIKQRIYYNRYKVAAVIGSLVTVGFINFILHLQETPITKRKRYIAFTDEQFMKIAKFELDMQWEALKDLVINPYDPRVKPIYGRVVQVAQKIIDSNQHLEMLRKQKWNVILIDSDEANAFVLPTGQIFVFKGMLNLTENLDQLAVVLGHEIAHVVLNHAAEKVSFASVVDIAVIIAMAALWFLMPTDGVAIISQWFYNKVVKLLLELPYSRKLETEADEVGLQLIARACFDVRESSAFWQKMAFSEELVSKGELPPPEWISTHPASETRAAILDKLIPDAIDLREYCHCPRLPKFDPRQNVEAVKRILQQESIRRRSITPGIVLKPNVIGMKTTAVAATDSSKIARSLSSNAAADGMQPERQDPSHTPHSEPSDKASSKASTDQKDLSVVSSKTSSATSNSQLKSSQVSAPGSSKHLDCSSSSSVKSSSATATNNLSSCYSNNQSAAPSSVSLAEAKNSELGLNSSSLSTELNASTKEDKSSG